MAANGDAPNCSCPSWTNPAVPPTPSACKRPFNVFATAPPGVTYSDIVSRNWPGFVCGSNWVTAFAPGICSAALCVCSKVGNCPPSKDCTDDGRIDPGLGIFLNASKYFVRAGSAAFGVGTPIKYSAPDCIILGIAVVPIAAVETPLGMLLKTSIAFSPVVSSGCGRACCSAFSLLISAAKAFASSTLPASSAIINAFSNFSNLVGIIDI